MTAKTEPEVGDSPNATERSRDLGIRLRIWKLRVWLLSGHILSLHSIPQDCAKPGKETRKQFIERDESKLLGLVTQSMLNKWV